MKTLQELTEEVRREMPDAEDRELKLEIIRRMEEKIKSVQIDKELFQYFQAAQDQHYEAMFHAIIDFVLGDMASEEDKQRAHEDWTLLSTFDKMARLYDAVRFRFQKKIYVAQGGKST